MMALLRAELLKLRTTRTFAALLGLAMTLSLLITYLTVTHGSRGPEAVHDNLMVADTSGALIVLLGVIGMTGEWRHRTITSAVLASPARARMLAAKVLAYAVAGIVVSLVTTTTVLIVATILQSSRGDELLSLATIVDVVWRSALVAALLGALSVCLGALVRNQTVAVAGGLIIGLVVDPLLQQGAPAIARFEPLAGVPNSILDGFNALGQYQLTPGVAVGVALAWIVATFTAAALLLRRRDLL
jgi:ABC-type transport system involved in multi-copper enzyme maturation permease subunit